MDLTKARKRAKEKAGKKKKARKKKADASARRKKAAKKARPPAEPEILEASADKDRAREGAAAKDQKRPDREQAGRDAGPPPSQPVRKEDIFTDDAFGEDLPPLGLDEKVPDSVVLVDESPGGSEAGPDKIKEVHGEDEDVFWEMELDKMKEAHPRGAAEGRKPPPGPPERKETIVNEALEETPIKEPLKKPGPVESADGWMVDEPGSSTSEKQDSSPFGRPGIEWGSSESDWIFGSAADKDDDFFALVTEDLYMREFGRQEEKDRGDVLELLSFRLASETYAVPLTSIRQIIKMMPITMVPRAPDYVLGIISVRGNIIPVFDLRRRLNLPATEPTRKTRIIVVAGGRYTLGLIVDGVEQVARLPETGLEPPPSMLAGVEAGYIEGIGRHNQKMILVLALDKIMTPVVAGADRR